MADNIYASPDDEDADLLGTTERKHTVDGTICKRCGIVHDISSDDDLPPEVYDKLSQFLEDIPEAAGHGKIIVSRTSASTANFVKDFISFLNKLDQGSNTTPLLLAMAEILNEMSGGKVEPLWRIYQTEYLITIAHTVVKAVNGVMEDVRDIEPPKAITTLFDSLLESCFERLHRATERYRSLAGELGMEIDEQLIETGVSSEEIKISSFRKSMKTSIQSEFLSSLISKMPGEEPDEEAVEDPGS